jgi:hypothetical protein
LAQQHPFVQSNFLNKYIIHAKSQTIYGAMKLMTIQLSESNANFMISAHKLLYGFEICHKNLKFRERAKSKIGLKMLMMGRSKKSHKRIKFSEDSDEVFRIFFKHHGPFISFNHLLEILKPAPNQLYGK